MKNHVKGFGWLLLALMLVLSPTGCGQRDGASDGSSFDSEQILVHGLQDQDFTITLGDLKKLPTVTKYAEASRSNGETVKVKATGPSLETFLQAYGKKQTDYSSVRFSAKDNYSIAVSGDILKNRLVILAYIADGKPLPDQMVPIRVVVPGERAMYWVQNMVRMDFETGPSRNPATKVVFLDTAVRELPQADYKYYENTDKAVKTTDLIIKYADINDSMVSSVVLASSDGLQKSESKENFLAAYIKISGQDAPQFTAPQFPQGMHIRDLIYIIYGQCAFFDYKQACQNVSLKNVDGQQGISLSDLIRQVGLDIGNKYKFNSADGRSLELASPDLGNALIYQHANGMLNFRADTVSGSNTMEDLLSIEVLR